MVLILTLLLRWHLGRGQSVSSDRQGDEIEDLSTTVWDEALFIIMHS
jgi:hypothetical protein